jgi:hypothetical protein
MIALLTSPAGFPMAPSVEEWESLSPPNVLRLPLRSPRKRRRGLRVHAQRHDVKQQAYLKASNTGGGDEFGRSVALSANGSTLAVVADVEASAATGIGGNQADNSASGSGAIYVFTRTGTT